jgi:hypothetical protein
MGVGVLLSATPHPALDLIAREGPLYAYRIPDPWGRAALADCALAEGEFRCERRQEGEATLVEDGSTRLTIRAVSDQPAYLLLADTYYPGWVAEVDGQPVDIHRANWAFRAVSLPAGQHEVVFAYQPVSIRIGVAISVMALVIMGAVMGWRSAARIASRLTHKRAIGMISTWLVPGSLFATPPIFNILGKGVNLDRYIYRSANLQRAGEYPRSDRDVVRVAWRDTGGRCR